MGFWSKLFGKEEKTEEEVEKNTENTQESATPGDETQTSADVSQEEPGDKE